MAFVGVGATTSGKASGVAGASLSGVTAGHGLVCFAIYTAVTSAQTLTDSSGTTWGLSKAVNLTGGAIAVFETTNAVVSGTHTVTASFSGGGNAWTIVIEDDQGLYSGIVQGQKLTAPGAGNTLVPGGTVGVANSSVYQLAIDNTHNASGFNPQAGAFTLDVSSASDTPGIWNLFNSLAVGGTNPGMAPGASDSTGADTYGVLSMGFAPAGMSAFTTLQPQFSEEPIVYFRSPDYAGLLFNRNIPPSPPAAFFSYFSSRPSWAFFESPFVSVYPVVEAFSTQAVQPQQIIVAQLFKGQRRLDPLELSPEQDDYRRWNHGVYWQYVRLYAAQLVGYTFTIPDLCDDPWLEWVHPKKSDESAIYPYRQISAFIRGQQFNLFFNQPRPWPVEGEVDTVDRKANYGVMLPWGRPAIPVLMPNVVGLPVAQAIGIIEGIANLPPPAITLQNNVLYQLPPYAPEAVLVGQLPAPPPIRAGIVLAQNPAAGAILQFPFFTSLIVSTGLVTLPGQGASTNYSPVNVVIGDDTPP